MKAMILAAGLGTRLRPLTDSLPKALISVHGKPMLDRVIDKLSSFGIDEFIINVHHHGNLIVDHIRKYDDSRITIHISDERNGLKDTGGALVHALPFIHADDDILIFNTDVLTDFDLQHLFDFHISQKADATLMIQKRQSSRMLAFNDQSRLVGWKNYSTGEIKGHIHENDSMWGFSGIHIVKGSLINTWKDIYQQAPFPIIPAYINSSETNVIVGFEAPPEMLWLEIGSPSRLAEVEKYLIENPHSF